MTDEECLVPCDGLYADITDDSLNQKVISLEQNTMKGLDINCIDDSSYWSKSGFHTVAQELSQDMTRLQAALHQLDRYEELTG